MYIEAITTCVGYADFLAEVLPFNRPHLDRWLIVTTPEDVETRTLCHDRSLEVLLTEDFAKGDFAKSAALDHGLQLLTHRDWLLHLDSDMVLPGLFRDSLEDAALDPQCIHGADRFMVRGWAQWQRLKESGFIHKYSRSASHNVCFPEGFPVGARWADIYQGYVPLGAFQLWHTSSTHFQGVRTHRYAPHGHSDASRTDIQFGLQWDRKHRVLLPEVICAHLESEDGPGSPVGSNWKGRTSKRFSPHGPYVSALTPGGPCS